MRIIDDIENNIREKLYKGKSEICLVSPLLVRGRVASDGISIPKLLKYSNKKVEFDTLVKQELTSDRKTDFYDFSLLMGQFFGVYNLYSYQYIDRDSRNKLVNSKVDKEYTKKIFDKYNDKIFDYISIVHNISYSKYSDLIDKMFTVVNDYSIYNNDVVKDICKILIGNRLYGIDYFDENSECLIECNEAIDYFDKCNGIIRENVK